jgi:uncharacterized membrane protein YagU involved in acid resistance
MQTVCFSLVYFGVFVVTQAKATALGAILYGTATAVFRWLIMFPAQGTGWLGWNAPGGAHLTRASLFNHIIFGLGMALWTAVFRPI